MVCLEFWLPVVTGTRGSTFSLSPWFIWLPRMTRGGLVTRSELDLLCGWSGFLAGASWGVLTGDVVGISGPVTLSGGQVVVLLSQGVADFLAFLSFDCYRNHKPQHTNPVHPTSTQTPGVMRLWITKLPCLITHSQILATLRNSVMSWEPNYYTPGEIITIDFQIGKPAGEQHTSETSQTLNYNMSNG